MPAVEEILGGRVVFHQAQQPRDVAFQHAHLGDGESQGEVLVGDGESQGEVLVG